MSISKDKIDKMLAQSGLYLLTSKDRPNIGVPVWVDEQGNAWSLKFDEILARDRWYSTDTFEIRGPVTPTSPEI